MPEPVNTEEECFPEVPDFLICAYFRTSYSFVLPDREIILPLGAHRDAAAQYAAYASDYGVRTGTFLTAWNPFSSETPDTENLDLNERLCRDIEGHWRYRRGTGQALSGNWPAEESFWVENISEKEARALACKYRQNAFVFVDEQRRVRILMTDPSQQSRADRLFGGLDPDAGEIDTPSAGEGAR